MARKPSFFQTNFSQGEVSSFIDARPDVAKRYNAVRVEENLWGLPEGGATRRPGLMFGGEVQDSNEFTRMIPFEFSVDDAFVLLFGDGKIRFIKNRAYILSGGNPYETVQPYATADLRDIHYEQSSDFIFLTSLRINIDIQKLIRVADTNWAISNFNATPPPSFAADTDISGGTATLTPGATTGNAVTFTASSAVFLAGDIRRQIIFGASRAIITVVDAGLAQVTARIVEAFPDTNPIAAGSWFLRGSPFATLDLNRKGPAGVDVDGVLGINAIRTADLGKYVKALGGTMQIQNIITAASIGLQILSELTEATTDDPAVIPAGSWRLEEASWSPTRGFPRTLVVHGGRLLFAGYPVRPTAFTGSDIDDIFNFAVGSVADNAYEYTIQGGQQNPIQWLVSLISLYIGDAKQEYAARGQGVDKPIGGAEIPFVAPIDQVGSAHVQPIVVDNAILLLQRFGQDIVQMAYSLNNSPDSSAFVSTDLTLFSRHIQEMGFAIHRAAYAKKPHSIVFCPLDNGQLACLTFKPREEVKAWARTKTRAGDEIESVAVVPHEDGKRLTVYVIVKRIVDGATKRFWEYFEDDALGLQTRITARQRWDSATKTFITENVKWAGLVTDCAKVGTILAGVTTITGITHLPNTAVDVIIGDTFIGQKTVSAAGVITLTGEEIPDADTIYEVGLHFDSTLTTLRPNIPGEVTEGLKRSWSIVFVRVEDSIGGKINGKPLKRQENGARMYTGLLKMENLSTTDDYDGALTILQDQPYPMTILNLSGQVQFGDAMV